MTGEVVYVFCNEQALLNHRNTLKSTLHADLCSAVTRLDQTLMEVNRTPLAGKTSAFLQQAPEIITFEYCKKTLAVLEFAEQCQHQVN